MRRSWALAGVLLAFDASAAFAGLDLSWNDCLGEGAAAGNVNLPCGDGGPAVLFGSLRLPFDVTQFVSLDVSIDLQDEAGAFPPFWNFQTGGCNEGRLSVADGTFLQNCLTRGKPWGESGEFGSEFIVTYTPAFSGNPSRARLLMAVARTSNGSITLFGSQDYFMFKLMISTGRSGICAGCSDPVAIVWNEAALRRSGGLPPVIVTSTDGGSSCATANGAGPTTCSSTPVVSTTWGQIKSQYR